MIKFRCLVQLTVNVVTRRVVPLPLFLIVSISGCSQTPQQLELTGATMGTTYSVKLVAPIRRIDGDALQDRIDEVLGGVNASMSTYDDNSELSRYNANSSTEWTPLTEELVSVVATAQRISEESDGAFDVTVGPLVNLWGFGPVTGSDSVPTIADIAAAQARVGYRHLHVREQPPALKKEIPDLYIDLSAIAKGYGVDRIAQVLDKAGLEHYLVEIGGELRGHGLNARGEPWRIAVERPAAEGRVVHQIVSLTNAGMATSGDYRNYFESDGRRFSHTIDPSTGRPVTHQLASVTVIHDETMYADAYATALLVMGARPGLEFADARNIAALFIVRTDTGFDTFASKTWNGSYGPSD